MTKSFYAIYSILLTTSPLSLNHIGTQLCSSPCSFVSVNLIKYIPGSFHNWSRRLHLVGDYCWRTKLWGLKLIWHNTPREPRTSSEGRLPTTGAWGTERPSLSEADRWAFRGALPGSPRVWSLSEETAKCVGGSWRGLRSRILDRFLIVGGTSISGQLILAHRPAAGLFLAEDELLEFEPTRS